MGVAEPELEMVHRHVREGQVRVLRPLELIAELAFRNQPTALAESLVLVFQDVQRAHVNHLERLISN